MNLPEGVTAKFEYYRVPDIGRYNKIKKGVPPALAKYSRKCKDWRYTPVRPYTRGGVVYCNIFAKDRLISTGDSICSMSDNFCYRVGREIALGRALKALECE